MTSRKVSTSIICGFFLLPILVNARERQGQEGRTYERPERDDRHYEPPERMSRSTVTLKNATSSKIYFYTSFTDGNWRLDSLASLRDYTYNNEGFYIRVVSSNKEVKYFLSSGNYYSIKWNDVKKCWDVFRDTRN